MDNRDCIPWGGARYHALHSFVLRRSPVKDWTTFAVVEKFDVLVEFSCRAHSQWKVTSFSRGARQLYQAWNATLTIAFVLDPFNPITGISPCLDFTSRHGQDGRNGDCHSSDKSESCLHYKIKLKGCKQNQKWITRLVMERTTSGLWWSNAQQFYKCTYVSTFHNMYIKRSRC